MMRLHLYVKRGHSRKSNSTNKFWQGWHNKQLNVHTSYARTRRTRSSVSIHNDLKTTICSYFTLGKRTLKGLTSNTDNKIAEFKAKFAELNKCLESRVVIQTGIDIIQIKFSNDNIERTLNHLGKCFYVSRIPPL